MNHDLSSAPPLGSALAATRPRTSLCTPALAVALVASLTAFMAPAHAESPTGQRASQGVRDPQLSDTDRVFMRGVAGLVIRNRQLGELGRKKLSSGPARIVATALSSDSDRLFSSLNTLAHELRTPIPMDMSDQSDLRLQALARDRGAAFALNFKLLSMQWLEEEIQSLEDATARAQSEPVRRWAKDTLQQRRQVLVQAKALPGRRS